VRVLPRRQNRFDDCAAAGVVSVLVGFNQMTIDTLRWDRDEDEVQ
jgi:hypothetical protein